MPTATAFTALGAGNGFPSCLTKINVLDRGDGNAYFNYKVLTLSEVMTLYWNTAYVVATASAPADAGGTLSVSLTSSDILAEPYTRVCGAASGIYKNDSDDFSSVYAETSRLSAYRLYSGDTSNESNFIGYGISTITFVSVEYEVTEFWTIYYTGLLGFDPALSTSSTITDVDVGGITISKVESKDSVSSINASITSVNFYTY